MSLGNKVEKKSVFGEEVYIKRLSGGRNTAAIIDLLQQVGTKPSLITEIGALLVVSCLCDESGNAVYDDVEKVRDQAAIGFLTEFTNVALVHSGLHDDADDLTKNSQAVQ